MNLMAELQRSNLDPQVVSMLSALVNQSQQDTQQLQQFSERIERDAAYIKTADLTIAALTQCCSFKLVRPEPVEG